MNSNSTISLNCQQTSIDSNIFICHPVEYFDKNTP